MTIKSASFLAANSSGGFVSFFDELYNPYENTKAYIIKGGPGTGKSTFIKKVARAFEKRGFNTELVYCSSDPDSLDALIVPEMKFSLCDGTSPHIVEPRFPGAVENIINPGQFWNEKKLQKNADEIRRLFIENSLYHRQSAGYLAAAGRVGMQNRKIADAYIRREKTDSFASRFIYRELSDANKKRPGEHRRRFLSAITPKGNIFLTQTVENLCTRVIGIDDSEGEVTALITERIGEGAIKNGYDIISCRCPFYPDKCEHLIIPEKGIALVRLNGASGEVPCDRVIHTARFMRDGFKENKKLLKFNSRIRDELIKESVFRLKKAKEVHDKLEKIYIDAMDFDSFNEFTERFIDGIFT